MEKKELLENINRVPNTGPRGIEKIKYILRQLVNSSGKGNNENMSYGDVPIITISYSESIETIDNYLYSILYDPHAWMSTHDRRYTHDVLDSVEEPWAGIWLGMYSAVVVRLTDIPGYSYGPIDIVLYRVLGASDVINNYTIYEWHTPSLGYWPVDSLPYPLYQFDTAIIQKEPGGSGPDLISFILRKEDK